MSEIIPRPVDVIAVAEPLSPGDAIRMIHHSAIHGSRMWGESWAPACPYCREAGLDGKAQGAGPSTLIGVASLGWP